MKYLSTRGRAPERGFLEILLSGLADDGGLYLPAHYPRVDRAELEAWRELPYADLAAAVVGKFATDIPRDDLLALCRRTYTAETYGYGRADSDAAQIAPLRWLQPGLALLELSNGPTLAFKDMAMQLLGALFEYALAKTGAELNILGATSGDTGSAAEYAMRGRRGVRVFMLSPQGRMSAFQRAQMFSLQDPNIYNVAIEGVFDDCQDLVKTLAGDLDFKHAQRLGSVNSINWARVAAQVVYYFRGYFAATERRVAAPEALASPPGDSAKRERGNTHADAKVSFCVPSGNFGNILAGWIAKNMGLPVERLVLATNENNVLDEFLRTGRYRVRGAAETLATSSPSMDISKASNFERYVFDIVGRDPELLRELWWQLDTAGAFDIAGTPLHDKVIKSGFVSGSSTHADRLATIRSVFEQSGLVIDPHTADGVKVAREFLAREDGSVPMVCLETALPAKFEPTIVEAIGRVPERPAAYRGLEDLPQRCDVLPVDAGRLREYIAARTGARQP